MKRYLIIGLVLIVAAVAYAAYTTDGGLRIGDPEGGAGASDPAGDGGDGGGDGGGRG